MGAGIGLIVHGTDTSHRLHTPGPDAFGLSATFIREAGHYSPGSTYSPKTQWCDFAIDVAPTVAAVHLVIRRVDSNGRDQMVEIPMREVEGAWAAWPAGQVGLPEPRRCAISVQGVKPGEQYAYRLLNAEGDVIAEQVSDPFALASTGLAWKEGHLKGTRAFLESLRREGDTDRDLLKRIYSGGGGSARASSLGVLLPPANRDHFEAPWSIVVDQSRLLEPHKVGMVQPHGAGERVIIKYHPWHSLGAADSFISPEFQDKRGYIECLKDRRFTDYLSRFGNTIEFFPLGVSVSDPTLLALGRSNVWGYMPTHLCGLNPEYFISQDPHDHIKTLQEVVYLLKERGFSVICDLVSGHTAETGDAGPFFSLRHSYPEAYFLLDSEGRDVDVTGCRNTLNPASPLVVELLRHQSDFYVNLLGVERRIDQAATLGITEKSGAGFDPYHETFQEITGMSKAPIVELMHVRGFHNREVPSNRPGMSSKDFWLRSLEYAVSFGETTMWPNSNPKGYRAFIASGSCGGIHPLQQRSPWSRNQGVQVFSHDGETVFDRARWMAVRVLKDQIRGDQHFSELIQKIEATRSDYDALYREDQQRFKLMEAAVKHLQTHHADKLEEAQGAAARWFLTQLYTTPGDILLVAGDQMNRTQWGNPDAYDNREALVRALGASGPRGMATHQVQSDLLTHRLLRMRDRFPEIFKNTSIVNSDDPSPSSFDPSVALSLSWHNQEGREMVDEDWKDDPSGELFLAWTYSTHPVHNRDSMSAHTRLFFADSSRKCTFTLPNPGQGREWRVLVDSTRPLLLSNEGYKAQDTYFMPTCGGVVMESVIA